MKKKKAENTASKLQLLLTAVLLTAALTASLLAGCGSGRKETQTPAPETTAQEQTEAGSQAEKTPEVQAESLSYEGELTDASTGTIHVKNNTEEREFATSTGTVYDFGPDVVLSLGDQINVTYHDDKTQLVADKIAIKSHSESPHIYQGMVTGLYDDNFVVMGSGMTVRFIKDAETTIEGDLSVGDDVAITYNGDINEDPYAAEIKVILDNIDPVVYIASGIVSETAEDSILLSIDSAYAYRIGVSVNTRIGSPDDIIRVGDTVAVRYQGNIQDTPEAISVEVVKQASTAKLVYHVMNGTIADVFDDSFTLRTKTDIYEFQKTDQVKYTGNKLEAGQIATVTYLGELNSDPVAVAVYCSLKPTAVPAKTPAPKDELEQSSGKTPEPEADTALAPSASPADKPAETGKPTAAPAKEPSVEPEVTPATTVTPAVEPETTVTPGEPEPADGPEGVPVPEDDPAEESGPESEPAEVPEEGSGSDTESGGDPADAPEQGSEPEEAPVSESESTEEPEQPAQPDDIPEEDAIPEPVTVIHAIGEIQSISDQSVSIETDTGAKLDLSFTEDTMIASGYLPDAGHVVEIDYDLDNMRLLSMSLLQKQAAENLGWISVWGEDACSILFTDGSEADLTVPEGFSATDGYTPSELDFVFADFDHDSKELKDLRFISHPSVNAIDEIKSKLK
ncbi:MAG: hypothetical protein IJI10_06745 [Eubacterium sp.]|nr:hypothetical protein [Eubacterium sp.]